MFINFPAIAVVYTEKIQREANLFNNVLKEDFVHYVNGGELFGVIKLPKRAYILHRVKIYFGPLLGH